MKKQLCLLSIMLFTVFFLQAKVTFFEKDGKTFAKITYKNTNLSKCNIIGSLTNNWSVPGFPMTLNSEGEFEYIHEFTKPKEVYRFYDPAKAGGDPYIEDPEALDTEANPYGSKNAVLRKPRGAGGSESAETPDQYPQLSFGLWSRTYYWVKIGTSLAKKIVYDKNGVYKSTRDAVEATSLTHKWMGEFGTEENNFSRIWLSDTKLRSSETVKVHGKALKYLAVDIELNLNMSTTVDYNAYWTTDATGTKADRIAARYNYLNNTHRNAASDYIGILFGPLDKNGEWGRWVGTKTGDWNHSDSALWVDQIVISFPLPDFEIKVGVAGNNATKSKDPMTLISGKRYGDKEDTASNLEFLIHPTKIKNLNINLAFAHTWRDHTGNDGDFDTNVNDNDRKWIAILDTNYSISIAELGVMGYMNSYAPQVIDSFNNADYVTSAWLRLKPIDGLIFEGQYANQIPTRYFDRTSMNNGDAKDTFWSKFRTNEDSYDILAYSAGYFKAGYLLKNMFDISYNLSMGGTLFEGTLAAEKSRFAGWDDSDYRVNGIQNYNKKLPYADAHRGAQIDNRFNLNVTPFGNDLLKISYQHDVVLGKLDGVMKAENGKEMLYNDVDNPDTEWDETLGKQKNKFQLDNVFMPGLSIKYGKVSASASAQFSLTSYRDDTLVVDGKQKTYETTTYFTFNQAKAAFGIESISDVLKSIDIAYKFESNYYEAFYPNGTDLSKEAWSVMKNSIQYKNFYNQLMATMRFAKDISVGLGGIVRVYRGDQSDSNPLNKYSNELIDKMSNSVSKELSQITDNSNNLIGDRKYFKRFYNSNMFYYINGGFALQFKYTIPVEVIFKPVFFFNVGLCWDPFEDGGDTTLDFKDDKWDMNNKTYTSETSIVAIGIQWSF